MFHRLTFLVPFVLLLLVTGCGNERESAKSYLSLHLNEVNEIVDRRKATERSVGQGTEGEVLEDRKTSLQTRLNLLQIEREALLVAADKMAHVEVPESCLKLNEQMTAFLATQERFLDQAIENYQSLLDGDEMDRKKFQAQLKTLREASALSENMKEEENKLIEQFGFE